MVRGRVLYEEDTPPRYTTAAENIEGEHSESQAYSDEYEQSDDWLDDRDSEEIEEEGAAALEQEPQEEFLFDASPDEPAAASAEQLEDDLEDGEQVDGDGSSDGEGAEDGGGSSDGGSGTESAQEGDGPRLDREEQQDVALSMSRATLETWFQIYLKFLLLSALRGRAWRKAVMETRRPTEKQLVHRLAVEKVEGCLLDWRRQATVSTWVSAHPALSKHLQRLTKLTQRYASVPHDKLVQRCSVCYRKRGESTRMTRFVFEGHPVRESAYAKDQTGGGISAPKQGERANSSARMADVLGQQQFGGSEYDTGSSSDSAAAPERRLTRAEWKRMLPQAVYGTSLARRQRRLDRHAGRGSMSWAWFGRPPPGAASSTAPAAADSPSQGTDSDADEAEEDESSTDRTFSPPPPASGGDQSNGSSGSDGDDGGGSGATADAQRGDRGGGSHRKKAASNSSSSSGSEDSADNAPISARKWATSRKGAAAPGAAATDAAAAGHNTWPRSTRQRQQQRRQRQRPQHSSPMREDNATPFPAAAAAGGGGGGTPTSRYNTRGSGSRRQQQQQQGSTRSRGVAQSLAAAAKSAAKRLNFQSSAAPAAAAAAAAGAGSSSSDDDMPIAARPHSRTPARAKAGGGVAGVASPSDDDMPIAARPKRTPTAGAKAAAAAAGGGLPGGNSSSSSPQAAFFHTPTKRGRRQARIEDEEEHEEDMPHCAGGGMQSPPLRQAGAAAAASAAGGGVRGHGSQLASPLKRLRHAAGTGTGAAAAGAAAAASTQQSQLQQQGAAAAAAADGVIDPWDSLLDDIVSEHLRGGDSPGDDAVPPAGRQQQQRQGGGGGGGQQQQQQQQEQEAADGGGDDEEEAEEEEGDEGPYLKRGFLVGCGPCTARLRVHHLLQHWPRKVTQLLLSSYDQQQQKFADRDEKKWVEEAAEDVKKQLWAKGFKDLERAVQTLALLEAGKDVDSLANTQVGRDMLDKIEDAEEALDLDGMSTSWG